MEEGATNPGGDALEAPIISLLQFYIKEGHVEPFERFMARILREARETPGCLWAYALRAEDLSPNYVVLSGWRNARVMIDFEETPRHVRATRMGEEEFFSQPIMMKRYQRFAEE